MISDKYGTPIDKTNDVRAPIIQPKFSNRFRVLFRDIGYTHSVSNVNDANTASQLQLLTAQVESFNRPDITFGGSTVNSFTNIGNIITNAKYGNLSFVIRDDILNTAISFLYQQLQIQIDSRFPQYGTPEYIVANPLLGINTKFGITMDVMDGRTNHTGLETWDFEGCQIISLRNMENSYENDSEIARITVECSFDSIHVHREGRRIFAGREYDEDASSITQKSPTSKLSSLANKAKKAIEDPAGTLKSSAKSALNKLF